ncbi:protein DpdE [Actinosynnema pretiosum]|uniref:Restriction endonuclease subunit R n=1 Tax=Actinosynnema pretiosum TaxID=42197 RepID=A0A290Z126_9PSEU|nr:protein DpdE [Actinosynnema pretiosum]ATE52697.1 restriction endonuclease subunit R [Actinosynnema pretiosum]
MGRKLAIGSLVTYQGGPGVGRVGELEDGRVRVDFFESVARPVVDSTWVATADCRAVTLQPETRVYWQNPDTLVWRAGRIANERPGGYFVHFPNSNYDFPLPESQLRPRWDRPVADPAEVLGVGGHESGFFRNTRLPFVRGLVEQRGASASTDCFLSSAAELYPHQVNAALTVLSDPVQRYLLADEVGLGKTVEAGFIVRQVLIDNPRARIVVLTPSTLRRQWMQELTSKFFIDDFKLTATVKFTSHETPEKWQAYQGWDLVVVDEAHRLAQVNDPSEGDYRALAELAHSAERLLLLSATPATSNYTTQLALLHLLDPKIYSWRARERFHTIYERRTRLADSVYGLDPDYTYLLPSSIEEIRELLTGEDQRFEELGTSILDLLDENEELRADASEADLTRCVGALRAHISETYRLHRRVLRNRRENALTEDAETGLLPYEVRGREAPARVVLDASAHAVTESAVVQWAFRVANHLLDSAVPAADTAYGDVLAVLASRAGVVAADLVNTLRWRLDSDLRAADRAGLTPDERNRLRAAPVLDLELDVLAELEQSLDDADEQDSSLEALMRLLAKALNGHQRAVVFCGAGSLAGIVAARLRKSFSKLDVGEHTTAVGAESSHEAVDRWSAPFKPTSPVRVLVADNSAEDGLNLQLAEAAFHLRLPWSPNEVEQRLGRLDRYRGAESVAQSRPARQFRISSQAGDDTFAEAWCATLLNGYGVFTDSISTLQEGVAEGLSEVWTAALESGPAGLRETEKSVHERLVNARREIDKMDMLESIHQNALHAAGTAQALSEFETHWGKWQGALLDYASGTGGGLGIRRSEQGSGANTVNVFDVRNSQPLMDPQRWSNIRSRMSIDMASGMFNRSAALRNAGTRLFRAGNPLVDALASSARNDDRGQATAFARRDPHLRGAPEPYFGFDYVVEADITEALSLVEESPSAALALRRQADQVLRPFMVQVWINANTGAPVSDRGQRRWLDEPYAKNRDRNYSKEKIQDLFAVFGGEGEFFQATKVAEGISREHMTEVTNLAARCEEARTAAEERIAVMRAQAEARQAAGHLVTDNESHLLSTDITAALSSGLTKPSVRLTAAICVVRVSGAHRAR